MLLERINMYLSGSSEVADDSEADAVVDRQIQHRTNTLMHVCWHRNTSVSMTERSVAVRVRSSACVLSVAAEI
jgi:FERM/RhoGEF/pleckstrin domain-containing protein 1